MSSYPIDVLSGNLLLKKAMKAAPSPDFGASESLAVWRGMRDGASTLDKVNPAMEWIRDFFGLTPKGAISDPRLEAIRRLTIALRLGLKSGEWEEARARRAGVAASQIKALKGHYARLPSII